MVGINTSSSRGRRRQSSLTVREEGELTPVCVCFRPAPPHRAPPGSSSSKHRVSSSDPPPSSALFDSLRTPSSGLLMMGSSPSAPELSDPGPPHYNDAILALHHHLVGRS